MFQTVLLAWEGSHPSNRALAIAREIVGVFDAELVVAVLTGNHEPAAGSSPELAELGVDNEIVVVPHDDPARNLVAFAHEHGFDLLVVGHHPPERTHRLFTHDIAQEILDTADIPVLVVAEDDFQPAAE